MKKTISVLLVICLLLYIGPLRMISSDFVRAAEQFNFVSAPD